MHPNEQRGHCIKNPLPESLKHPVVSQVMCDRAIRVEHPLTAMQQAHADNVRSCTACSKGEARATRYSLGAREWVGDRGGVGTSLSGCLRTERFL